MKISFLIFLTLVFHFSFGQKPPSARSDSLKNSVLFGTWQVVRYIKTNGISAMTYDEANKFLGEQIKLSIVSAVYFGDTCFDVKYKTSRVKTSEWLYNNYRTNDFIKIDSVTETELSCNCEIERSNSRCHYGIVILDKKKAFTNFDGIWFELKELVQQ